MSGANLLQTPTPRNSHPHNTPMPSPSLFTTTTCNPNPNPNSHPLSMQATRFLRLLAPIIHRTGSRPPSVTDRVRRIRRAAYASMACAAGPRRAWSRALLRRLRRRARVLTPIRVLQAPPPRSKATPTRTSRTDELRRLVPGGRGMDVCSLLEEAGSYIQCLSAQVKVMQSIANSLNM